MLFVKLIVFPFICATAKSLSVSTFSHFFEEKGQSTVYNCGISKDRFISRKD